MVCSQCGSEAKGRYCPSCGASLKPAACRTCSRTIPAGTRFCTHCGTGGGVGGGGAAPPGKVGVAAASGVRSGGWWVSAGLLGALALVVLFSELAPGRAGTGLPPARSTSAGGAAAPPTGAAAVDLGSMTPRQAADALFNRVMGALSARDTIQARTFLPMAIEAHRLAEPLDADGLFHLALLRKAAGDHAGALATALVGLEQNPRHLLNLGAAADASRELGDMEGARARYRTLLDAWTVELAAGRAEYEHHSDFLPILRAEADAFLGTAR